MAPTITPSPADLLDIAHLSGGWPAVFSCNEDRHIWRFATRGLTPHSKRYYVHGRVPLLDAIAACVLKIQAGGGRFYFTDSGVYLAAGDELVVGFERGALML